MERDAPRPSGRRPQIAAIVVGYQIRWHADNIVTRLLEGYWINQTWHEPRCQIASVYVHERGPADVSRRLAAAYDFALAPTIDEALTLGTGGLAVDGVVVVTESPSDEVAFGRPPVSAVLRGDRAHVSSDRSRGPAVQRQAIGSALVGLALDVRAIA